LGISNVTVLYWVRNLGRKLAKESLPISDKVDLLGLGQAWARLKAPNTKALSAFGLKSRITGSIGASAIGTVLAHTGNDELSYLGYGLIGYGTANMFAYMRQGMLNNLETKGLIGKNATAGVDAAKIFNTEAQTAFTVSNLGLGVLPWGISKAIIDPRQKKTGENNREASSNSLWASGSLLAGGMAISVKLGLVGRMTLPKFTMPLLRVGNAFYLGKSLMNGNLFMNPFDVNKTDVGLPSYTEPSMLWERKFNQNILDLPAGMTPARPALATFELSVPETTPLNQQTVPGF
jgi:hypothetical protein